MTHRTHIFSTLIATSGLIASASSAATFTTTGEYDSTSNANVVDASAPGSSVATFTTAVANAFAIDAGGVMDFGTGDTSNDDVINAVFGDNVSKTLRITVTEGGVSTALNFVNRPSTAVPISGTGVAVSSTNSSNYRGETTFNFGAITDTSDNSVLGENVVQAGLTLLSRNSSAYPITFTVTANFAGGGSASLTDTIGGSNATDDTFFGFSAPSGDSITSLVVLGGQVSSGDGRPVFDDLGFVTSAIPEPASLALLGVGGLLLAGRRRG